MEEKQRVLFLGDPKCSCKCKKVELDTGTAHMSHIILIRVRAIMISWHVCGIS